MNYSSIVLLFMCCISLVIGIPHASEDVEKEENEMDQSSSEETGEDPTNAFDLISSGNLQKITLVQELEKERLKKAKETGRPIFSSRTLGDAGLIYDGDILGDEANSVDPLKSHGPRKSNTYTSNLRAMFNWHRKLWITRTIPYVITSSIGSSTRSVITKSFDEIRKNSCLKFRPKMGSDKHWIEFFVGPGCYSGIGKKYWSSQPTRISLGSGCSHVSVVAHELLHAIGFPHEQSRRDRDSFVRYYPDRVTPGMESNFRINEVEDINSMGTTYDYKSIMHYSATSFSKSPPDHTLDHKFDPQMPLGNSLMSPIDKVELNLLYQCDHSGPWSRWSDMSACVCGYGGDCTKAKVRFCISENRRLCPEADSDGVEEIVKECPKSEADRDNLKRDGNWGEWGSYTSCSGDCGWGTQTRNRLCNNPVPTSGGKDCVGHSKEHHICRRKRCGSAGPLDTDFTNANRNGWNFDGFSVVSGRIRWSNPNSNNLRTAGPSMDHTREVINGNSVGYYAAAWGRGKSATMSHQVTNPKSNKCLMFYYMLNGEHIRTDRALTVYLRETRTRKYVNLNMNIKGHTGNYWRRAALNIGYRNEPYEIVISAEFQQYRESAIAIDDIFFDNNACPPGLNGCNDLKSQAECQRFAQEGRCNSNNIGVRRNMLGECCVTCQDPKHYISSKSGKKCEDRHEKCLDWRNIGECVRNPWMITNCCHSCVTTCTDNNSKCAGWVTAGYCNKQYVQYMWVNCCKSCTSAHKSG